MTGLVNCTLLQATLFRAIKVCIKHQQSMRNQFWCNLDQFKFMYVYPSREADKTGGIGSVEAHCQPHSAGWILFFIGIAGCLGRGFSSGLFDT